MDTSRLWTLLAVDPKTQATHLLILTDADEELNGRRDRAGVEAKALRQRHVDDGKAHAGAVPVVEDRGDGGVLGCKQVREGGVALLDVLLMTDASARIQDRIFRHGETVHTRHLFELKIAQLL